MFAHISSTPFLGLSPLKKSLMLNRLAVISLSLVIALSYVVVFQMYTIKLGENYFITLNHSFNVFCIYFIISFVSGSHIFILQIFLRDNALEAGALGDLGDGVFVSFACGA